MPMPRWFRRGMDKEGVELAEEQRKGGRRRRKRRRQSEHKFSIFTAARVKRAYKRKLDEALGYGEKD